MNIRFRTISGGTGNDVYIDQIYINATHFEPSLYSSVESFTLPGQYHYSFWSKDVNGNIATSATYDFDVLSDSQNPIITNVLATPSTEIQGPPVNVTCDVTDNAKLQDIRIFIMDPNNNPLDYSIITNKILNQNTYYYTQVYYTIGTYHFYIWAKDVNNNAISSDTFSFEITNCPPLLSNEAPTDRSTNILLNPTLSVTINHYTNDNVEWWIYLSTSETGPWEQSAHDNLANGNGVVTATTTTLQDYYTRYYWKVEATDGTDTTIEIYSFVTKPINTAVNTINPYTVTTPTVSLTTSGSPTLDDVALWYRYSSDNITWSTQTPGDITNTGVPTYDYEWDTDTGRFMDAIRLGTSEYYLIAYQGESSDGYLRTIRVSNNKGTIQQSLIDTWEHDDTDGGYDSIMHVADDVYAITYRDATRVTVFTVNVDDANGDITNSAIDTQLLTYSGYECNMVHVNDNIYAVAYRNTSTVGWIETISIDSSGNIGNNVIDSLKFNGTNGYFPKMIMIDSDTVAIVYQGSSTDGYLRTYNISSIGDITNTRADEWRFDGGTTGNGGTPNIIHINGNVYAIAYEDYDGDGQIKTLTIDNTGKITKSWIDTLEFDTADAGYQSFFHAANNVYGVSYQGTSADGYLCTITIDNDGTISNTIIDSLEFDIVDNVWYATVIPVFSDYFLIVYETTGNDGMSRTVEINTDQTPGDISVLTYEWDTDTGRYMDAIRLGTSEYYLIAYLGETSDGYLRTIRVRNNNGMIQQSLIDNWEHDTTDIGGYDSIMHVVDDVYAIAYRDASPTASVTIFTVNVDDSNGDITNSAIDTKVLTYSGYECNMVHVNDNIYAVAYRDTVTDGWIETISIDRSGNIGDSVIDSIEFNGTDAYFPKMTMIDYNTVAIVYQGYGSDGYVVTYNISSIGDITNTWANQWEFDTAYGGTPNIIHINGDVHAIAYRDSATDGWIKTLTIADTGVITKSWIDTLRFDSADSQYQSIFHVAYNVYGVSYQGTSADGYLCTMTIDDDGMIGNTIIDSLEFDIADNFWYATVIPVSDNYFLIVYEATGNDGMSRTVEINTDAGWKVWTDVSNPDTTSPWSWNFNFPDGFGYYQFFSIGSKTGIPIETEPHKPDAKCHYYNTPPTVSDIPDQTIIGGSSFTTINLDDFVTDENPDSSITWTYSGNTDLTIDITNHVATITYPVEWIGSETITFKATDTGGLTGSDAATYTVTA
jgi:hypothetical protein